MLKRIISLFTRLTIYVGMAAACSPTGTGERPADERSKIAQPGATADCSYSFQIQRVAVLSGQIEVELYRPIGSGEHPLIVVLHGSEGALTRHSASAQEGDNFGESVFAEQCFTVALPHYFEPFGIKSTTDREFLRKKLAIIVSTIEQITNVEENLPDTRHSYVIPM